MLCCELIVQIHQYAGLQYSQNHAIATSTQLECFDIKCNLQSILRCLLSPKTHAHMHTHTHTHTQMHTPRTCTTHAHAHTHAHTHTHIHTHMHTHIHTLRTHTCTHTHHMHTHTHAHTHTHRTHTSHTHAAPTYVDTYDEAEEVVATGCATTCCSIVLWIFSIIFALFTFPFSLLFIIKVRLTT